MPKKKKPSPSSSASHPAAAAGVPTVKNALRLLLLAALPLSLQGQTLDECRHMARQNYPLIKKYELIDRTTELTLSNINKGWLPQVQASAQATVQNRVAKFPEAMTGMLNQAGMNIKGMQKEQYRVGIDVTQTLYDGGRIRNKKLIARQESLVERAQNDVSLYTLNERINELYFGILLVDEKLSLNKELQALLLASEKKLEAMVNRGTAATSDWQTLQAERLSALQQQTELEHRRKALSDLLTLFTGREITRFEKPEALNSGTPTPNSLNLRPELRLFSSRQQLCDAREKALNSSLLPHVSAFAQGFYGYPGLDMYDAMMNRHSTLNGTIGLRIAWSIDALYTRRNDRKMLRTQRQLADNQRETFLFNNHLEQQDCRNNLSRYNELAKRDRQIANLRKSVRVAAESKLSHGVIDVNDLRKAIYEENEALENLRLHELQHLKEQYELKTITNI